MFSCALERYEKRMILRALASNQPYTLISIPVVVVSLLSPMFSKVKFNIADTKFPADTLFVDFYSNQPILLGLVILLILGGAMLANHVFNKHEFLNIPVFVPAFVYSLSAAGLSLIQLSMPALLANVFILLALNRHLAVFRQQRVLAYYFESAFWYGMAAVIFPPFIVLLAGMLAAALITRAFHWRELLIPIVSFSIPFLYWVAWMYIYDNHEQIVLFDKTVSWDAVQYFTLMTWPQKAFTIACGSVFVAALPRYLFLSERGTNKSKSVKNVFLIITLSILIGFGIGYLLLLKWILLALVVPITFVAGYWFSNYRFSFIAPFVFYAFCAAAVVLAVTVYT